MNRFPLVAVALVTSTAFAQSPNADEPVMVHLEVDNSKVRLMHIVGTTYGQSGNVGVVLTSVKNVCAAPCDTLVPQSSDSFYIGGVDVTPSIAFSLADYRPGVTLKVKAGNSAARTWGSVMLISGISLSVAGGLTTALGVALPSYDIAGPNMMLTMGLVSLGIGVVLAAIGIPVFRSGATNVDVEPMTGGIGVRSAPKSGGSQPDSI